ncbi:MAG: urease accessory protein UreF [Cyanobacteria bacterium CRU_2_1]|nr:urease accessory protein UreF [Cyanobacteria bacterium RU_5_0]NJR59732.1 urease accessory protein UreF [Cyanobacteria bacterium CRU_2_1]
MNSVPMLHLLQLVSPALPVGAYSYSEGLETLVQSEQITDLITLEHWLTQELQYGAIRLESAVLMRIYRSAQANDRPKLSYWNQWLSAFRETEELREQSWQMGRSLSRLLQSLQPDLESSIAACEDPCNFVTAFALASVHWQIDCETAVLGYLHSWASNLVSAGVRLIPLGQTQGQHVLLNLYPQIEQTVNEVVTLADDELECCGWGLSIASMTHETLYSRLFRS